jgi:prophage regulatory protein
MHFLRIKRVCEKVGLARSTIYQYMQDNRFPQNYKLGGRCVAWLEEDIEHWINQCINDK